MCIIRTGEVLCLEHAYARDNCVSPVGQPRQGVVCGSVEQPPMSTGWLLPRERNRGEGSSAHYSVK
jgi:hypothetical protein